MGILRSLAAFILVAVAAVLLWQIGQPFFAGEWATSEHEPVPVITWTDTPATVSSPGVTTRTILHPGRDPVDISFDLSVVSVDPGQGTRPSLLAGTTETIYILQGTAALRVNQTAVLLGPGDAAVIPPGTVRWLSATDGSLCYLSLGEPPGAAGRREWLENATNITYPAPAPGLSVVRQGDISPRVVYDDLSLIPLITPQSCAARGVSVPTGYDLSVAEIPPGGGSNPHLLVESVEIQCIVTGSAQVTVDGRTRTVSAGQTVIIGPGRVQEVRNEGEGTLVYVTLIQPHWTAQQDIPVPETF